jgi:hypothetical protein
MVLQTIALPLGDRATGLKVVSSQQSAISQKKCAEASILYPQTLGDELSFFIPNGFQVSVLRCESERKMRDTSLL